MKAVVKIGGKQYLVAEKETLLVDLLPPVAQGLVAVGLEEAVVAEDLQGDLPP